MPQSPMDGMEGLLQQNLGISQRKQQDVAEASQRKQNQFNPLNIDNVEHVDGDTFRFKDSDRRFRVRGEPGQSVDTYESDIWAYTEADNAEDRFKRHRRNYAKLTGKPEWTITRNELIEQGKLQAAQTKQRMEELGSQGLLDFRTVGVDDKGRELVDLIDKRTGQDFFANHAGREQNASYDSKFNAGQRLKDFFSGERGEHERFTGSRSFKDALTDQPINLAVGAGRMLNELGQSASVLTGTNSPGVDQFFGDNRDRLDRFKQRFVSKEQQGRERLAEKNAARNEQLFGVRKQKYLDEGDSERTAARKAGIDEFGDSIKGLLVNPGRILDATVESLPYMLGVASVGRAAVNATVKGIEKRILKEAGEGQAKKKTAEYLASEAGKKELSRAATTSGITTVGLTEGLSTSADVYDSILNMTEEEALQSEKYQALRFDQNMSHKEAVKELATEAFGNTLGPVTILAAAAGGLTGAAGFESKLFTTLAGVRKSAAKATEKTTRLGSKAGAGEQIQKGAVKTLGIKGAKAVGKGVKHVSGPGLKETAEEAIQSGGGELLSQIAKSDITGEEVGPGVGAATAEGAIIGFASGAGISAVTDSTKAGIRALAQAKVNGNDFLKKENTKRENIINSEIGARPGGNTAGVQSTIDNNRKNANYNSGEALTNVITGFEKNIEENGPGAFKDFNSVEAYYKDALKDGKVSASDKAAFEGYREVHQQILAAAVRDISKKESTEYTEEEQSIIEEASRREAIPKEVQARLNPDAQDILKHNAALNTLQREAEQAENIETTAEVTGQSKQTAKKVYDEKFGEGIGSKGPGLGWYLNEMSSIMSDPSKDSKDSRFLELSAKFAKFIGSQQRKLERYQAVLADPEGNHGRLKFVPQTNGVGGTQAFVEQLTKEKVAMQKIRNTLLAKYKVWHGKGNPKIAAIQPEVIPEIGQAPGPVLDIPDTLEEASQPKATKAPTKAVEATKPVKAGELKPISEMSVKELKQEAKTAGIKGYSKLNRSALVQQISEIREGASTAETQNNKGGVEKAAEKKGKNPVQKLTQEIIETKNNISQLRKQAEKLQIAFENDPTNVAKQDAAEEAFVQIRELEASKDRAERIRTRVKNGASLAKATAAIDGQIAEEISKKIQKSFHFRAAKARENFEKNKGTAAVNVGAVPKGANVPVIPDTKTAAEAETPIGDVPTGANIPSIPDTEATTPEGAEQAEAQPAPAEATESERQKLITQNRVDRANRLKQKAAAGMDPSEVVLAGRIDNERLQVLMQNSNPVEALEQLISELQPDPNVERINTPDLDDDVLNKAINAATALNQGNKTKAQSLPSRWRNFTKSKVAASVFVARKLPESLADAFNKRSENTNSLLDAVPNLMEVLSNTKARNKIYDALDLTPSEERAMEAFRHFYAGFSKSLLEMHQDPQLAAKYVGEDLEQDLLNYFTDDNNELDPNVVAAMALESMTWLMTSGPGTLFNNIEKINTIMGRNDSFPVSSDEIRILTDAGTLRNIIANTIGKAVFRQLNMKQKANLKINPLFKDKLIASIGSMAVGTMLNPSFKKMEGTVVDRNWFLEKKKNNSENNITLFEDAARVNFVRSAVERVEVDGVVKTVNANRDLINAVQKGNQVFNRLFGTNREVRLPSFEKPTEAPTRVSRSLTRISQKMRDRILSMSQREWVADLHKLAVVNRFDHRELLQMAMGYVDEAGMAKVHATEEAGVQARNRDLETGLQDALDWGNLYGDDTFYFNYKMTRSGRVHIDSNVINPQASKIHRWLFGMKEWAQEIPTNSEGTNLHDNFLIAVASGLGIAADKKRRAVVLAEVKEVLGTEQMAEVLAILAENSTEKFTSDQVSKIRPYLTESEGFHTLAALTAYAQYKHATGDSVTITLPMETDGVTNGFIAGLLQTPSTTLNKFFKEMLRAGGIFLKNDPWTNYPEWLASPGNEDNYQQISGRVSTLLNQMVRGKYQETQAPVKATKEDERNVDLRKEAQLVFSSGFLPNLKELVEKVGRNWAKNPLTVVSYGASIASVIRAITDTALVEFHTQLAQASTVEEIHGVMRRAYTVINATNEANGKRKLKKVKPFRISEQTVQQIVDQKYEGDPAQFAKNFELQGPARELFETAIAATYGEAISRALDEKMKPLQKIRAEINHANKLMNLIFVKNFMRRVDTLEKTRNTTLTPDDRRAILERMHKEGLVPALAMVNSDPDTKAENLELTNYETSYLGGPDGKGEAHFNQVYQIIDRAYRGVEGKKVTPSERKSIITRILSELPNSDVGVSGVVKMIHSLDGVNNSEAWGIDAVLNLHDAQLANFNQIDSIARNVNKNFIDMHGSYSIADEALKSLFHMMTLMNENDSRLSVADKNAVYIEFQEHLEIFDPTSPFAKIPNPRLATEGFIGAFQQRVIDNNNTRKKLFGLITVSNQFAKEGAEHIVNENVIGEVNNNPIIHNSKLPIKELLQRYFNSVTADADLVTRADTIDGLLENLQNPEGNIDEAIVDYIENKKPRAKELLEVLQAVYTRAAHPAGKTMALLNNLLYPYLGTTKVIISPIADPKASSTFSKGKKLITIDPSKAGRIVSDAMHEIVHAGTVVKIEEMEKENPEEFKKLFNKAIRWASRKGVKTEVASEILAYRKSSPVNAIAEYLAYTLTEEKDPDGSYRLLFGQGSDPYALLTDVAKVLQDQSTGRLIFRSSGEATTESLFANSRGTMLEADKMQAIFEDLVKYEQGPIDPVHQNTLNRVLTNLVIPGITSLENTLQQYIAVDPYGTQHIGEADGDLIRLQASGNALTTNVDMSLQEVAVHEYLHPILKEGIRSNHFLRKEARRLFDLAKENLTADSFLPETVVGDPTIAAEKAQIRYDYIFNNGEVGYDEFMAIGLTNKPMIDALTDLDNRNVAFPVLGQGILNALFELARRIVQWVGGQSQETAGGNVHQALTALAQATIANNQRNLQRVRDAAVNKDQGYWLDRANKSVADAITDRLIDPLRTSLESRDRQKLDPKNPTVGAFIKSATYVAITAKDKTVRQEYNRFYRSMNGRKDNFFFDITREFTPWNEQDLGTEENPGWMDLLRKSKVIVDQAREKVANHTRSYLNKSMDKNNHLTSAHKQAITRAILKTDLSSLMEGDNGLDIKDIQDVMVSPERLDQEVSNLHQLLKQKLDAEGAGRLITVFDNQMNSLANFMVHGEMLIEHGMLNAHNIVNQFMLPESFKIPLSNNEEIITLVDQITSLKALQKTPVGDKKLALDMVNHEMSRTDVGNDNGFSRLIGSHLNFKMLAQKNLFSDNPIEMQKGYVYEIFDGDTNIEYVLNTKEEHARMLAKGMRFVTLLPNDDLDKVTPSRAMFIGNKGLAGYNKSIVSLTDLQHRGVNLFEAVDYSPNQAYQALSTIRDKAFRAATRQFNPGHIKPGTNLVPILNEQGEIVDYRYMMSERNKQKILKKEDPYDRVLPRMFASITDRNSTTEINRDVVDLMWDEYDKLDGHPEHAFIEISQHGSPQAKEMWNLLPADMKRYAEEKFGGTFMYLRDDVVNLVLGFRKISIANNKMLGKAAPIVKMSEKIWQEIVQLMRVKIAVLTPRVVIGNMASNAAMLLSEGIKPEYIRQKGSEAISAMRAYQRDVQEKDELLLRIGSDQALKRDTRKWENELGRLRANIETNPVHKLVGEGLFTSITEDLGVNDNSIRTSLVNKATDKTQGVIPKSVVTGLKELYMLPGTKGYQAGVAATQYGDFVARYVKYHHDTSVKGKNHTDAINDALAAFIYYDIPQSKYLQFMNDNGLVMFTKFFLRIQPIVARMYTQNPVGAFGVLALQQAMLPKPFNENIAQYGLGSGLTHKPIAPWNLPGKAADVLDVSEPALLQWLGNPFGL